MKLYRVSVPDPKSRASRTVWTMQAKSISHAVAFLRHWPSVKVCAVREYGGASPVVREYGGASPVVRYGVSHVALVNKGDPGCYVVGSSTDLRLEYAARSKVDWAAGQVERYRK